MAGRFSGSGDPSSECGYRGQRRGAL